MMPSGIIQQYALAYDNLTTHFVIVALKRTGKFLILSLSYKNNIFSCPVNVVKSLIFIFLLLIVLQNGMKL